MRIRIFDSAKLDLVDGFSFYEAQASGVGQYFLDSLYSDIDSLALYAGIHLKKAKDFYWMLSKRFPLQSYFGINGQPGAAPNGGPATPIGNSGVTEGPPSVS